MERRNETDGFVWIQAEPFLREGLVHGFTTRLDPQQPESLRGLNLGLHVGDDVERVLDNRRRVFHAMGLSLEQSVWAEQVHGTHVEQVGTEDRGRGAFRYQSALSGTDALLSAQAGVALACVFADCVPVFLFEPRTRTIGLAHAGWRGVLAGMAGRTADAFVETAQVRTRDLLAYIGPCISASCYRVDDVLAASFAKAGFAERIKHRPTGPCLDLRMCVFDDLRACGVQATSITVSKHCTCREESLFFSHRRDGRTGRMAGIIMKEKE